MNNVAVDPRLLAVFEAVMAERSVSRAARRIGMSQPAVSSAIARLRDLLKDDLFLRVAGGVRPTPRALELAAPVHAILTQLSTVFAPPVFHPRDADRVFTLATSDHCAILLMPALLQLLQAQAPLLRLRMRPKSDALSVSQLESGEVDLVLGVVQTALPPQMRQVTLFREAYLCAMRAGRMPARARLDFDGYMAAEHLVVTHAGEPSQLLDQALLRKGHERRITMTINHALLAPFMLERSDLVLTSYRQLLVSLPAFAGLRLAPLPFRAPPLDVKLLWHNAFSNHPAHQWLRRQIQDVAETLAPRPGPNGALKPLQPA
jgi:DNA-binding transcriptional LysR family regulator